MNDKISLYFHIPFCVRKCNYCAFYSLPSASEQLKDAYCDALIRQLGAFAALGDGRKATSIYFGGGTPTVIGRERLCRLIGTVLQSGIADPDCEVTVEANPCTVDREYLRALRDVGANRLSVGVQSLVDSELLVLGRVHTSCDAVGCIGDAFDAGFDNVSADMIFAFNTQTPETALHTARGLISLGVTHIAAYSLQYEQGTPMYGMRDDGTAVSEDTEEQMYALICGEMRNTGFRHYEISAFSRGDGYMSRHNLGYWQRREYFGFGAAAHSLYGGVRFSSGDDVYGYINAVSDTSPFSPTDIAAQKALSSAEINEERIMLSLRTDTGISLKYIKNISFAERCVKNGLANIRDGMFALTETGYRVSNAVIAELI